MLKSRPVRAGARDARRAGSAPSTRAQQYARGRVWAGSENNQRQSKPLRSTRARSARVLSGPKGDVNSAQSPGNIRLEGVEVLMGIELSPRPGRKSAPASLGLRRNARTIAASALVSSVSPSGDARFASFARFGALTKLCIARLVAFSSVGDSHAEVRVHAGAQEKGGPKAARSSMRIRQVQRRRRRVSSSAVPASVTSASDPGSGTVDGQAGVPGIPHVGVRFALNQI